MRTGNRNHPLHRDIAEVERMRAEDVSRAVRRNLAIVEEHFEDGLFRLRYHATDDLIDRLALGIAQLPGTLTVAQKERLRIIARELARRIRT